MKFLPLFCAATVVLSRAAVQANGLVAEASPLPAAAEALPVGAVVVSLEAQPTKVTLSGKYEAAQLVLTARLASGDAVDVTRLTKLQLEGAFAELTPQGQVKPLHNGVGEIQAELGGQKLAIPVEVADVQEAQTVDFIRDVNPVMTKLGCNAGSCHGAKDGKFGFKLSLRGYDPIYDVRSLKDDLAGRRLNAAAPEDSLMLLKATGGVPHEGGVRTKLGEKYYQILLSWITDGAKLDLQAPRVTKIDLFPRDPVVQQIGGRQQVRVVASFSNGKSRDVTAEAFVESGNTDVAKSDGGGLIDTLRRGEAPLLARYEGNYAATTLTVMGDRTGFTWAAPETWSKIDELVASKWQRMKIQPSELCSDAEFLRRVSLDLTGLPPSAEDLRAFLVDTAPTRAKREALINKLIGSPEFVEHWTNKWADLLQVNSKFLGPEGTKLFRDWIHNEVEANTPYDQFVRKIITATGSNKENPAASYWKVLREPEEAMENTTHLFLATRFNCNKCHDHPFERWTQDQYYRLGAYFAQVQLTPDPASGKAVIVGTAVEKTRPLYEIVQDAPTGEMIHLRTNVVAPPKFPYEVKAEPTGSRRAQLAAWIANPDNRYFATSYVNRLWGYLTGAGVIEPLDDIRAGNPPTNPELLEYLRAEFVEHGFDMRHVLRLICQSRTYQLGITTNRWNDDDKINYSHALARRLPAEVLYDAVLKVTDAPTRLPGGARANQLPDSATDLPSGFLANLGRPARESACECERSNDLRLGSIMALLSGPAVADAIGDSKNGLTKLLTEQADDTKLVDEIFRRVLNRPASDGEVAKTIHAWSELDDQNKSLLTALEAKEIEQRPVIAQADAARVAGIEAAKAELARYEVEIAPKLAEALQKQQATVAASEAAIQDYANTKLPTTQAAFEGTLTAIRTYTGWQPLDPVEVRATGGLELTKQPDGTVKSGPQAPASTDYTIIADTEIAGITGLLLEVLPSADAPNFGPGSLAGNFVLSELAVKSGAAGAAALVESPLSGAVADFSQESFSVATAVDGKKGDGNNGWAVSPQFGVPHYAAFQLKTALADPAGARLQIELNQPRPGNFHITRFRLWVTTSAQPLNIGLPLPVAEALKKPAVMRSPEELAAVAAYWNEKDPELLKLRLNQGLQQLPLPTDPGLIERRAAITKAEEPIRLEPKLVQLRQDVEQSKAQMANRRLTSAQDLTWALINTPAFLFNH